jgi:membrane associated rhomboid family serine protease
MIIVGDDNETRNFPVVNSFLILTCIAVFIWQIVSANQMGIAEHGVVPRRFLDHLAIVELGTLISAMFMHADFFHIIGNLWYLFIFGDNIEDHFGHFNYLAFYITCGIIGGLTEIAFNPTMSIPSVGASGAIAGVLGAYLVLFPQTGIKTWWGDDSLLFGFRTFMIPAWVAIGGWFVLQYIGLYFNIPGIGWHCHLGGFTAGMLTVFLFRLAGEHSEDGFGQTTFNESNAWFRVVFSLLLVGAFAVTVVAYVGGSLAPKMATAATAVAPASKPAPAPAVVSSKDPVKPQVAPAAHPKDRPAKQRHRRHHSAQPQKHAKVSNGFSAL